MKQYISFRSALLEVFHKNGQSWKTTSGWGSKNKEGSTEYFETENQANDWANGTARMKPEESVCLDKYDTSCPVELDDDGNDKTPKSKS